MMTAGREGVIKFCLNFKQGPAPDQEDLVELNAWRDIFMAHGLIGQDPNRYHGLGFGNLSRRLADNSFLITGTQTGHCGQLKPEDYAIVLSCEPKANILTATGTRKPSSEALSHGIIYQSNSQAHWVMHLHSPEIFQEYRRLSLPFTDPSADYGTPEMATEIQQLVRRHNCAEPGLLVMAGHQDGILAFGKTADDTGKLVMATLEKALQAAD